jgi:hypothetical protein
MARYDSIGSIFPDWLKGHRRIEATLASDGIVVIHWPDDQDSFVFTETDQRAAEVLGALIPKGILGAPWPPPNIADVRISGWQASNSQNGSVVWEAPWKLLHVSSQMDSASWSPAKAETTARAEVQFYVTAHLLQVEDAKPPDICDALRKRIDAFRTLLGTATREEEVQVFLTSNPVLLAPDATRVTPKVKLGTEYVTDFVVEHHDGEYILVEIEPPSFPIFTKSGDPSARLTHAQQQVEDWKRWVTTNNAYARENIKELADVTTPQCWVIIGRRPDTARGRKALVQKNSSLHGIRILTYDSLIERAENHLANLKLLSQSSGA